MIILHNPLDKASRDFVAANPGHTVLDYPGCVALYPHISAFPSVVVEVPAYHEPEQEADDSAGGTVIMPAHDVPAHVEIARIPASVAEVESYQAQVNQRALDRPPLGKPIGPPQQPRYTPDLTTLPGGRKTQ